jgi:hypothetical protein
MLLSAIAEVVNLTLIVVSEAVQSTIDFEPGQ